MSTHPAVLFDLDQFGIRRWMHPIHNWGPRVGANRAGMFDLRARPRLCGPRKGKLVHRLGIQFACGLWPTITA
jgi:hypothetical protein